jgi:hypothetical protein
MEINISQDIRKYKTKDVGNFSFKEAGFLVLGFGLAFITYKLTNNSLEVALIPFAIVAVFAFFKPNGMSCWQFLKTVGKEKLIPSTLINETDFIYDLEELKEQLGAEYHVVIPEDLIQSSSDNKNTIISKFDEDLIIR